METQSRLMVRNGYTFDWPKYSKKKYAMDEEYAKVNKLGLQTMKSNILETGEKKYGNKINEK